MRRTRNGRGGDIVIDTGNLGMQLDTQPVATAGLLKQVHDGAHLGLNGSMARFLRRVLQRPVIAGGVGAGKQQFRIGPLLLGAGLQRIGQLEVQIPIRAGNRTGTSADGNRFGCENSFHSFHPWFCFGA